MARECPSLEGLTAQSQTREINNSTGRFTAGARRQSDWLQGSKNRVETAVVHCGGHGKRWASPFLPERTA